MRKILFLLASTALITAATLTAPATARDRTDRSDMTANQLVDQADAQTARMKVDLHLTADQDKNWAGFEGAMHDMSKKQADRKLAARAERKQSKDTVKDTVDVLDRINKGADAQIERSNDWKKLAEAAKPLYTSLDDQQKRSFAEGLFGGDRGRDNDR